MGERFTWVCFVAPSIRLSEGGREEWPEWVVTDQDCVKMWRGAAMAGEPWQMLEFLARRESARSTQWGH